MKWRTCTGTDFRPVLRYMGGKWWEVSEPITLTLSDGDVVTIPAGMVTDLISVPRFLWGLFPPFNDALVAYLFHDWAYIYDYRQNELGDYRARRFADCEMLRLSQIFNPCGKIDNYTRFFFVRLFGWYLFKKNRLTNKKYKNETFKRPL